MKLDDFCQQYAVCRSSDLPLPLSSTPPFITFVSYWPCVFLSLHALSKNYPILLRQHLVLLQICYCNRGMGLYRTQTLVSWLLGYVSTVQCSITHCNRNVRCIELKVMQLSKDSYLTSNLLREHARSLASNLRGVTAGSCTVVLFSLSLSLELAIAIKYICRSSALFLTKNRTKGCSLKDESLCHSKRPY